MIIKATRCPVLFRSFTAALHTVVNPDNVKASVRLYKCGSDGRMMIECFMKWSDVAILAFTFCSRVGLCDVDKKTYHDFFKKKSISILITILTQTDMLYSYKCILCEFETYIQRKPIRPFPKSCNMSIEQTYGKIHIYIYIYIYIYIILYARA